MADIKFETVKHRYQRTTVANAASRENRVGGTRSGALPMQRLSWTIEALRSSVADGNLEVDAMRDIALDLMRRGSDWNPFNNLGRRSSTLRLGALAAMELLEEFEKKSAKEAG